MRLAFLGTPDFAVQSLAALLAAGHEVVCVYSQPPAPRGRGQTLQPSPVHAFAEARGLMVRTPVSMKTAEAIAGFQALDLDIAVVVAFGQILVAEVLDAPRLGCFNVHKFTHLIDDDDLWITLLKGFNVQVGAFLRNGCAVIWAVLFANNFIFDTVLVMAILPPRQIVSSDRSTAHRIPIEAEYE